MSEATASHIVDENLGGPASYLTIRRGDQVFDLYGWAVGPVAEPQIVATRDEFFDGLVVDFRGRHLFVDAPEVKAIHHGVVVLGVTLADLERAAGDPATPPRRATGAATREDAAAVVAALSHLYSASRVSLAKLESDVERALEAATCADLDAIAGEVLEVPVA